MLTILLCAPIRRSSRVWAMADALSRRAYARVLTLWTDIPQSRRRPQDALVDGVIHLDTDPDALVSLALCPPAPSFHVYSALYQGWPLGKLADWHQSQGIPCAFERLLPSLLGHAQARGCRLPASWTPEYDPTSPFGRTPRPSLAVPMELCSHEHIRALQRDYLAPGRRAFDLMFFLESRSHTDLAGRVRGVWGWYAPPSPVAAFPTWSFELSQALFSGARVFAAAVPDALRDYVVSVSGLNDLEARLAEPPSARMPDAALKERLDLEFSSQALTALFGEVRAEAILAGPPQVAP